MVFEIGSAVNGGADWLCDSPAVFAVLSNPVATALVITAMALAIAHAVYGLKGVGWRQNLKAGFWLAVGVSALVFVHYAALGRHLRQASGPQGVRDVLAAINHSAAVGGGYEVVAGESAGGGGPAGAPALQPAAPRPARDAGDGGPGRDYYSSATGAMRELGLRPVVLASDPRARANLPA